MQQRPWQWLGSLSNSETPTSGYIGPHRDRGRDEDEFLRQRGNLLQEVSSVAYNGRSGKKTRLTVP